MLSIIKVSSVFVWFLIHIIGQYFNFLHKIGVNSLFEMKSNIIPVHKSFIDRLSDGTVPFKPLTTFDHYHNVHHAYLYSSHVLGFA